MTKYMHVCEMHKKAKIVAKLFFRNAASLTTAINAVRNVQGATATDQGIDKAISEVYHVSNGARSDAVKVCCVISFNSLNIKFRVFC